MGHTLVTGGASGIGLTTSEHLLAAGRDVVSLDLRPSPLAGAASLVADVTDPTALLAVADELPGPLDGIVCAAGIWDVARDGNPQTVELDVWDRTLAVNLTGTMLTVRTFEPALRDDGAIVTFGSIAGITGMPRRDAYTATKGAVVALTRAWAIDYSRRGVRVNCVCPGPIRTPMLDPVLERVGEENLDVPQQRIAEPSEVASVVAFLLSDAASYVSGQILGIDGGASAGAQGLRFPRRRPRDEA